MGTPSSPCGPSCLTCASAACLPKRKRTTFLLLAFPSRVKGSHRSLLSLCFKNLDVLRGCVRVLQVVTLTNFRKLNDISALSFAVTLHELTLTNVVTSSVENLRPCTSSLEAINFAYCRKQRSIAALSQCRRLQRVSLRGCEALDDIEALRASAPTLRTVDLSLPTRVVSLEPLTDAPQLTNVFLDKTGIRSLETLCNSGAS